MTKLTDQELMDALAEQEMDDAMDEVLAMTPEERRKELQAAGFDLKEVDARADAWAESVKGGRPGLAQVGAAEKEVAGTAAGRTGRVVGWRRWTAVPRVFAATALSVAAAAGAVAVAVDVMRPAGGVAAPNPAVVSRELREEAFGKCARKDWVGCKESLDRAFKTDPAGEGDEAVKKAREEIRRGLASGR